jgi:FMN phosphatase YigB (HAD superfamily)
MIKALIFDVGGVLVRTEDYSSRRLWEKQLALRPGESESIVFNSEMGVKAQLGVISDSELWAWVGQRLGLPPKRLHEFRQGFWAGDVPDERLIAGIRRLRPNYQTAIISNASDALLDNLTNKYKVADAFDLIIGSAEEGMMKPSVKIYELALRRLKREPGEAVFIDDFAENVRAARELGMGTIHFRSGMDVLSELAQWGVT